MRQSLIGLAHMNFNDEKVRRWTLNTFARIGNDDNCVEAVQHVMARTPSDEIQTIAAGVAAIHKVSATPYDIIRPLGIDPQLQALAALQHIAPGSLDLSVLPLRVERASPDLLRLALLVIGLGKSPQNLLDPNYSDAAMVKVLGSHDDAMVLQYSVWAITENKRLGLSDLGIDLRDIEGQPANVRSWIYQLIGMHPEAAGANWGYIIGGSRDKAAEARGGLIHGLRDFYADGLDEVIFSWVAEEQDREVRERLYDHMIRQSAKCPSYADYVVEIYEAEPDRSPMRERMEVSASGTSLFGRFRRIAAAGSGDLFKVEIDMSTSNTFNNNGNLTAGALSVGGKATNKGDVNVQHYNPQIIETVKAQLTLIEDAIKRSALDQPAKDAALGQIAAAKAEPTPGKIRQAVDFVDGLGKVAGAGIALAPIVMPYIGAITSVLSQS
jgi:hypothetical protein